MIILSSGRIPYANSSRSISSSGLNWSISTFSTASDFFTEIVLGIDVRVPELGDDREPDRELDLLRAGLAALGGESGSFFFLREPVADFSELISAGNCISSESSPVDFLMLGV